MAPLLLLYAHSSLQNRHELAETENLGDVVKLAILFA